MPSQLMSQQPSHQLHAARPYSRRGVTTNVAGRPSLSRTTLLPLASIWLRSIWWASICLASICLASLSIIFATQPVLGDELADDVLHVGFAHADITPDVENTDVWLAGYFPGRKATSVHDPLFARTVVLRNEQQRLAIVSLDLIGFQLPDVETIRAELADFAHVVISSTHNHEGPDVIGIWGRTPLHTGKDPAYMKQLSQRIVETIRKADANAREASGRFGVAVAPALIRDGRKPIVKDDKLRLLQFVDSENKNVGAIVQWSCHPEAMGPRNKAVTADFPATTLARLRKQLGCPTVYVAGAVGGLMAPPREGVESADGKRLVEGEWEYAERYGEMVADLAMKAAEKTIPVRLAPIEISTKQISIPVVNPWYRVARLTGVVKRPGYRWENGPYQLGANVRVGDFFSRNAIATEVTYIRCGELHLIGIPGEIYPELIYGGVPDPSVEGADYPNSPIEPTVVEMLPEDRTMILGLANDEIGYIMPKRQWDQRAPYAYQRRKSQYGEINSCGPDTAPIIMNGLRDAVLAMPK
jgi:hypothetical protein